MSNNNYALVDNWLLELASQIIERGLPPLEQSERYWEEDVYSGTYYYLDDKGLSFAKDSVTALLQLLDLMVIHDKLVFDEEWSNAWKKFSSVNALQPLLSGVKIGKNTRAKLTHVPYSPILDSEITNNDPKFVQEGANYYLSLSRLLGVFYWPAPQRSEYLTSQIYSSQGKGFSLILKDYVDTNIHEIITRALTPLASLVPITGFTGFGIPILANCDSRKSIITTALEFRNSQECKAFRAWLQNMDNALQEGDIKTIADNMKDIRDLLVSIQKGLGIEKGQNDAEITFQIGLSPSISLDSSAVNSIIGKLKPKKYHLVFLRNHFSWILRHARLANQIKRLFPEVSDLSNLLDAAYVFPN